MSISVGTVAWMLLGSLLLAILAVVIDRVNFPQKPFRPRRIHTPERGASRDRTGAHIVEELIATEGRAASTSSTSPGSTSQVDASPGDASRGDVGAADTNSPDTGPS